MILENRENPTRTALPTFLLEHRGLFLRMDCAKGITIGCYRRALKASWEVGFEINHLFEASLTNKEPNSRETHLEFFWVDILDLKSAVKLVQNPREAAFWHELPVQVKDK